MTPSPLAVARDYLQRGWAPIPVPYRTKRPVLSRWPELRLDDATVGHHFGEAPSNIGVLLGPASNGLADVDLDSPEAVSAAPAFLPRTAAVFGRADSRASHWLYQTDLAETVTLATIEYLDPCVLKDDKATLVELRIGGGGVGAQTVFPGSIHVSGQPINWEGKSGDPAIVDGTELRRQVGQLAAAALLARHWPVGARHKAALALGGALAHGGWTASYVKLFVEATARAANDEEWPDRVRAAV